MNNNFNTKKNENKTKYELYGDNFMLVWCRNHDVSYLVKCNDEEFENEEIPTSYIPPHANTDHLECRCEYIDWYNMGIINIIENKDKTEAQITIIKDTQIDFTKFGSPDTQFIDFYDGNTTCITDTFGNKIKYKNENLAAWFQYIQNNKLSYDQILKEGDYYF